MSEMRERPRIGYVLMRLLATLVLASIMGIIFDFVLGKYPVSSTLLFGVIFPIGALLLHAYIFWRVRPPKRKWFVIGAFGMAGMTSGVVLTRGPEGLLSLPIGLIVWAFGMHASLPRGVE